MLLLSTQRLGAGQMELQHTNHSHQAPHSFTSNDARAESGVRQVTLEADRISIQRRYKGVAMRLNVPASAYRGVALLLRPTRSGGTFYQLSLVHADADLSVVLEEAPDDREIVANWTQWSAFFTSPRLVERAPGKFEAMDRQIGGLAQGDKFEPRRTSLTRQRRGRFLSKRKPGVAARADVRFANEREIVCYE